MNYTEDVKDKILKAAAKLFMKNGYRKTSLRMIGKESQISHTQIIYHFSNKSHLGNLLIKSYFRKLIKVVEEQTKITGNDNPVGKKLYWWSLHYLILTTYKGFSKFYIEYVTDESDDFIETAKLVSHKVYGDMFGLEVNLGDTSFLVDMYIITSIDIMMAKLCIEKSLKVREAIKKLINLDIIEGFRVEISESEIENFIINNSLLDVVDEFNVEKYLVQSV